MDFLPQAHRERGAQALYLSRLPLSVYFGSGDVELQAF